MPQLTLTTNLKRCDTDLTAIRKTLSANLAQWLGKPEDYCMILLQFDADLCFAGTDEPAATVEMASLGLAGEAIPKLTKAIYSCLEALLPLDPSRVYIRFISPPRSHWAWNGKTFG